MLARLTATLLLLTLATAQAQERCTPIRFGPGQSSATVTGMAPAEDVVCYTLAASAGQTADVSVKGRNVIFSILDVTDAQDHYTFKTKARTYTLRVGQLMRAVTPERFSLSVAVR